MLKKVIREKDKEKLDMNVFKELGKDLNYKDILQVDGAFSACHINYGKSLRHDLIYGIAGVLYYSLNTHKIKEKTRGIFYPQSNYENAWN